MLLENGRRTVRALEVIEITGRPYSASLPTLEYADPHTVQIGVDIDRPTLDARIEQRVDLMFEAGFVAEVERLLDEGLAEGRTASGAIGYREVVAHLRGELTLDEARERTVFATRRFARRQDGWFRKDPRIVWLRYDDPDLVDHAPEQDRSGAGPDRRQTDRMTPDATGCASCSTRCSTRSTAASTRWRRRLLLAVPLRARS